jgi:pyruvate/2-oxoglutarate/acetoin dehydrogenase E1 component
MSLNKQYNDELKRAMNWLGAQKDTIFLGQAVTYAGTGCYESLVGVPDHKKMEFPVAENFQIGVSTGLALNGFVPVSVVPRWNFLLSATDQIVNHLDKMMLMNSRCQPKVIIRVAVGSENPIDPQDQHKGNFSEAFRSMCKTIRIVELTDHREIVNMYQEAYAHSRSTILVEFPDYGKLN